MKQLPHTDKIQQADLSETSGSSANSQNFRDFFDYSLALFCTHDYEGNLLSINPAAAAALGYAPEQLIGLNLAKIVAPAALALIPYYLTRIQTNGQARGLMDVITKNGEKRIWSYNNVRRIDADGNDYATRLRSGHYRAQANGRRFESGARRGNRVGAAEIGFSGKCQSRNPHADERRHRYDRAVAGLAARRDQRDYAETIRQSSDALLTVINDILDFSKIESGKLRFESVDFDLREVVESMVEMLARKSSAQKDRNRLPRRSRRPQILSGDPGRLRQVLTNLVGNAVKFTERGEIGVWVKAEKETEKTVTLRFTITDTGIGISREERKNLFQPFTQVDSSTTRQYGGTGLGLAISKQIVEMMNGKISVESQPQVGSKFSFTAVFAKAANQVETNSAPEISLSNLLKGQKILLADSSPIIRQTLKQYCAFWEMNAVEATSGEESLRLLYAANQAGKAFDIAVIDMNLPDWEGFSLARKIKLDKSLSNTSVVLTTVYGQRGDGATAQEIGVAAYLTKPVRGSQFFDCLAAVLKENQKPPTKISELNLVTRHSLREAKTQAEAPPFLFADDSLRVLAVEDNETNRLLITKQLKQIGISADVAVDGAEALEKIAASEYRLVLMDCQMPRLDGYEATRRIRLREKQKTEAGEDFSPLIVIALTAHTLAGEREKCRAAGMNDYLSKPVKVKDLATLIRYWCESGETANEIQMNKAASETKSQSLNFLSNEAENKDFAEEIYALYLTETQKRLEELKLAADKKDGEKIARIAHAVRGNSLAVGISSIAQITEQIQILGKQNKFEEIPDHIAEFSREFSGSKFAEIERDSF